MKLTTFITGVTFGVITNTNISFIIPQIFTFIDLNFARFNTLFIGTMIGSVAFILVVTRINIRPIILFEY